MITTPAPPPQRWPSRRGGGRRAPGIACVCSSAWSPGASTMRECAPASSLGASPACWQGSSSLLAAARFPKPTLRSPQPRPALPTTPDPACTQKGLTIPPDDRDASIASSEAFPARSVRDPLRRHSPAVSILRLMSVQKGWAAGSVPQRRDSPGGELVCHSSGRRRT